MRLTIKNEYELTILESHDPAEIAAALEAIGKARRREAKDGMERDTICTHQHP